MYRKNKIELLSPAGNFDSLKAAIGNGADSIYFGSEYFSARGKATNFTGEEIEKAIDYAHLHSCSIYLALNTLLMDHELDMAKKIAISAFRQGVDAVIVQDIGFARLLNDLIPELPLHASTQASICDKYSVDAWHDLGVKRIILPREFSIEEIKKISVYANDLGIETEVFAHGALCVSYSGQCLMSSMIGSRSGNRGECAQPCRLTYDLVMNNRTIKKSKALISTRDMSAINLTEELKNSNVTALKIEGRMRSAEYVGTATRNFRKAIDNPDSEKIDLTELLDRKSVV